jgi:hypothetical protein
MKILRTKGHKVTENGEKFLLSSVTFRILHVMQLTDVNFTLMEDYRLRLFERKMLRRMGYLDLTNSMKQGPF